MVIHPPMLYMGYVGLSVAFSFAVAALIGGNLDADLGALDAAVDHRGLDLPHPRHRPRQLAGPTTSSAGAAGGSGIRSRTPRSCRGWSRTALIHSLAVTEKRDSFKSWTVLLAILAFSLSLLGTFLVRSGVLSSVHAFATDPRRGLFILAFLVVVDRRLARALRLAGAERSASARASRCSRARRCCSPTTCCWSSPAARCCSARSIRSRSTRSAWARSRSARRTSRPCSCRCWRRSSS